MAEHDGHSSNEGSRLWRLLPWILVGSPVLILLVVGGVWLWSGSSLDSKLAELKANGQPTTAAEINDFYVVPSGVADTTYLWVAAIDGVAAAGLSTRGGELPIIGTSELSIPPPGEEWAELEASRTLLKELDPEMQLVWKAAQAGGQARFPVDFSAGIATLLPHTQNSRDVARLLALDAHVAAHDKDYSRSLQDLRAIFALSDSLRGEPCLISQLVRIAIHAIGVAYSEDLLPHCQWSDAELQSLQQAIEKADFKPEFRRSMSGERATCLAALDTMAVGPFRKSNKMEALRLFEISLSGLEGTWAESIAEQRKVGAQIKSMASGWFSKMRMMGVLMLMPAHEQATIAGARAEARQRAAIIGLALQRHRLKHGELPKSLKEIDPAFLASQKESLFTDPFNDKPLIYKAEESTVTVYSVGRNEQDDGGKVNADETSHELLDVGFQLQR